MRDFLTTQSGRTVPSVPRLASLATSPDEKMRAEDFR